MKILKKKIEEELEKNPVCLFMKGTPEVPQCGFSLAVSNVLKHLKVDFKGINVLEDNEIREGIKEYSDWPTIPQLYVKKKFVGGSLVQGYLSAENYHRYHSPVTGTLVYADVIPGTYFFVNNLRQKDSLLLPFFILFDFLSDFFIIFRVDLSCNFLCFFIRSFSAFS